LLIEEGRTNALQHSANFKNTTSSNYWENPSATTVTVDQTTSPDGGVNADLLTTSATAYDCFTRRGNIYVGSTQYSYSIFVKRGPSNYRYVGFYLGAGASSTQFPYFDFDNPTTVQVPTITSGTIGSTGVDAYPNGWYRIRITFTTAATPIATFAGVYISSSNGTLQLVNPAGNDCYIWGIQSELGAFPTSYIPTTTGILARSADVCSITGANFTSFYNFNAGTIVGDLVLNNAPSLIPVLFRSFLNEDNKLQLGVTNTVGAAIRPFIVAGGSTTYSSTQGTTTSGTQRKLALAYAANDAISCLNATLGTQDVSVTPPTLVTIAEIGFSLTGTIAALRYYKKRLPNAKLQALTV
jgi:hypothetical protein